MQRATKLVEYARSLCDLENSKFITYDDETNLLNEAYRDLYSLYTETSGDYWTKDEIIQLESTDIDPNSLNGKEYLVDLPKDFYKIRFLSYNSGGSWTPVDKFSTSMRDSAISDPYYRLKNNKLWIISPTQAQFKITYYIPPALVTLPNYDIPYLEDEPVYELATKDLGEVIDGKLLYAEDLDIMVQNVNNNTILPIYTSILEEPKQLQYYGGYIYWIEGDVLYRAPTDFVTQLTPQLLFSSVENYLLVDGNIHFSDITDTYSSTMDGTTSALLISDPTKDYQLLNDTIMYIDNSGFINYNIIPSTIKADRLVQYNDVMFYYVDNKLYVLDIVDGELSQGELIESEVFNVGYMSKESYLPIRTEDTIHAKSMVIDTEFDYPSNEVNEIMAYLSAVGFSRKQSDTTKMQTLQQRLAELISRFQSVSKRDEYQYYRINNDISTGGNW